MVNVKQDNAPNLPEKSLDFPGKLVKIKRDDYWPEFLAAKSSVKEIEIDDIKSINGVCRKWNGTSISEFFGVPEITDYMTDYIANHKMFAYYTFNAEDPALSEEEYPYGRHTTYLIYNRAYPRKRLIKERKLIDKMSDDVLNKNKLVRFTWVDD